MDVPMLCPYRCRNISWKMPHSLTKGRAAMLSAPSQGVSPLYLWQRGEQLTSITFAQVQESP